MGNFVFNEYERFISELYFKNEILNLKHDNYEVVIFLQLSLDTQLVRLVLQFLPVQILLDLT